MAKVHIQLFGGEKDGYNVDIDLRTDKIPEMFYIWRGMDDEKIREARGTKRATLTNRLAVLAYVLDSDTIKDGIIGGREYRYRRCVEADKKLPDPAV